VNTSSVLGNELTHKHLNEIPVLILPGLWNSGPEHWQTRWEDRHPSWRRIAHADWETPDAAAWVKELNEAISDFKDPPILVAHSLSCALVAHWAIQCQPQSIMGAFLVAPSDVEASTYPAGTTGFAPMPTRTLPFPSLMVASANDPYVDLERARHFAQAWGSTCLELGSAGHISSSDGFGSWTEGLELLSNFIEAIRTASCA
jgi:predicted alpha/beta hydrolase family esterase